MQRAEETHSGRQSMYHVCVQDLRQCPCVQSTVVGPDMIFGVLNFWATVNRKIEIKVMRVGECPYLLCCRECGVQSPFCGQ